MKKSSSSPATSSLEARLRALEEENARLKEVVAAPAPIAEETVSENVLDDIRADDYITVVSLCPYKLNLTTLPMGKGKIVTFNKFGEKKRIIYSTLTDIIENHSSFLEAGYFYILDKRLIRKMGYDDTYQNILSKEKMDRVLECGDVAVDIYKTANSRQQGLINHMIIKKIKSNEFVDMNVVREIGKISKTDLIALAEENKEKDDDE